MNNIVTIDCTSDTYVDKHHPSTNLSQSKSFYTGVLRAQNFIINLYKSILNFSISNLEIQNIDAAFLYVFVEELKVSAISDATIAISGNYGRYNLSAISWDTFPNDNFTKPLNLTIPPNSVKSYIRIDVTPILKELSKFDVNYNFILSPLNLSSNIMLRFSSSSTTNKPYLKIKLKDSNESLNLRSNKKYNNRSLDKSQKLDDDFTSATTYKNSNNKLMRPAKSSSSFNTRKYSSKESSDTLKSRNEKVQNLFSLIVASLASQSKSLAILQNKFEKNNYSNLIDTSFKEILDKLENSATIDDIESLNSLILTLINTLEIQNSSVSSLQEYMENINTKIDSFKSIYSTLSASIINLNESLSTFNDNIIPLSNDTKSIISKLDTLNDKIDSAKIISHNSVGIASQDIECSKTNNTSK